MCGGTSKTSNSTGNQAQHSRESRRSAPSLVNSFSKPRVDKAKKSVVEEKSSKHSKRFAGELSKSWSCPGFDLNEIRLIVYQDCERRGRQVLFDSTAIRKIDETRFLDASGKTGSRCYQGNSGANTPYPHSPSVNSREAGQKDIPKYQYARPASDVSMLGEMMFGSVAMSYRGSTLKIHYIRSPPQLMMSKVFSARVGSFFGSTNSFQGSFEYISQDPARLNLHPNGLGHCLNGSTLGVLQPCSNKLLHRMPKGELLWLIQSASFFAAHSTPVDMPSRGQNEDRDSAIARSASLSSLLMTPLPSPSPSSTSYQRRWLRSQTTSLENGIIPRRSIEETFSMADESCGLNPALIRRKKIAISIIFTLPEKEEAQRNFQDFFFSHFPLFESHMGKLKSAIEMAMITCRKIAETNQRVQVYISRVMDALDEFRTTIWNLYTVPRIAEPVWLTMMSCASEKNLLCQHFLKEFAALIEQSSKNQFLAALVTAVLTYHLAWVPTVMPVDHLPIRAFSEKHASPSMNRLAKSHPYNPLWAQLGDLYGAVGSPVRMTRTVIVGKRKDFVQRILYVLTYFLRCSELQENHLIWNGQVGNGEQAVNGSKIMTTLEKGEVEESDYVVVTIQNEPALLPPALLRKNGPVAVAAAAGEYDGCFEPACFKGSHERLNAECSSEASPCFPRVGSPKGIVGEVKKGKTISNSEAVCGRHDKLEDLTARMNEGKQHSVTTGQLFHNLATTPCPKKIAEVYSQLEKVTFQIGSSTSPESDSETQRMGVNKMQEKRKSKTKPLCALSSPLDVTSRAPQEKSDLRLKACTSQKVSETQMSRAPWLLSVPQSVILDRKVRTVNLGKLDQVYSTSCENFEGNSLNCDSGSSTDVRRSGQAVTKSIPCGDVKSKPCCRMEENIPRNESSDSALGESDDEGSAYIPDKQSVTYVNCRPEELLEVELALPRSCTVSSQNMIHFGRSLLGGYCTSYMPDLVLHGISSDEQLKQHLSAELSHAINHPVLDEPIAEAVYIIADTDKWTVQVATSQRKVADNIKLGKDVLVSSQVSSLLQSVLQLYKLNLSADFCIMHLEDRLQEMYHKSTMLSKYLRGQTRVHVKELGVVLGIESNDLPLLAAIASTHSPYVAQILL